MSDKRKSNLMGVKPTLDINPLTRDFKQPESVLKKTAKSGPSMAEIGAVVGLGTAAGYTSVKKSKDVTKKETEKPTKKEFSIPAKKGKPAGAKVKGGGQEEYKRKYGVQKKNLGPVERRSTGGKVQKPVKAAMGLLTGPITMKMAKKSEGFRDALKGFGLAGVAASDYLKDKYGKSEAEVEQKVAKKSLGGEMKRGYGAARQKGMGLQDEGLGLEMSKGSDYIKDLL